MLPLALLAPLALAEPTAPTTPSPPGLYTNRIGEIRLGLPFVEVCWREGEILADNHPVGGVTTGGSCVPGDVGFVITQQSQGDLTWPEAKMTCAIQGMRLPELPELNAAACWGRTLGIIAPPSEWGWAGNSAEVVMSSPGSRRPEASLIVPAVRSCNQLRVAVVTAGELDACGQDCASPLESKTSKGSTFCVL